MRRSNKGKTAGQEDLPALGGFFARSMSLATLGKVTVASIFFVSILGFIFTAANGVFKSSATRNSPIPTVVSAHWQPTGFLLTQDANVAYKWDKSTTCAEGDSCALLDVITHKGCPNNFYIEVQRFNSSNTEIDWSNALRSSVAPEEKATLEFDFTNSNVGRVEISRMNCS